VVQLQILDPPAEKNMWALCLPRFSDKFTVVTAFTPFKQGWPDYFNSSTTTKGREAGGRWEDGREERKKEGMEGWNGEREGDREEGNESVLMHIERTYKLPKSPNLHRGYA